MLRLVRSRSTRILAITGIAEIDMVGRQKQAEQDPVARIGQVAGRHEVAEAEPQRERQHHPHHRSDERGAPRFRRRRRSVSRPVISSRRHHADDAEGVEQMQLLGVGGKDRRERDRERSGRTGWGRARCRRSSRRRPPASRPAWRAPRQGEPSPTRSASWTSSRKTEWPGRLGSCTRAQVARETWDVTLAPVLVPTLVPTPVPVSVAKSHGRRPGPAGSRARPACGSFPICCCSTSWPISIG